uniref:Putative secreted protein n=1 Tax=Anopheles triannulatus TaxID=58253 RepID=A0A2M4B762_9DIPT
MFNPFHRLRRSIASLSIFVCHRGVAVLLSRLFSNLRTDYLDLGGSHNLFDRAACSRSTVERECSFVRRSCVCVVGIPNCTKGLPGG